MMTGKIYLGVHGTDDIDDGYLGSGKFLLLAIKKYGKENFVRQVIHIFDDEEIAYALEKEVVDQKFILRKDVYNCTFGGRSGGKRVLTEKGLKNLRNAGRKAQAIACPKRLKDLKDPIFKEKYGTRISNGLNRYHSKRISQGIKIVRSGPACEKQSKTMKERGYLKGVNNPGYGTRLVYNDKLRKNKRVKKEDFDAYLEKGWFPGMKAVYYPNNQRKLKPKLA